jgi:hypothetical protein
VNKDTLSREQDNTKTSCAIPVNAPIHGDAKPKCRKSPSCKQRDRNRRKRWRRRKRSQAARQEPSGDPLGNNDCNVSYTVEVVYGRLESAFETARSRTEVEAQVRKDRNDQGAKDTDLPIGSKVLLRNFGVRGRNKIQDVWCSNVFQVVEKPYADGNLYVIETVDGMGLRKTVQRFHLRKWLDGSRGRVEGDTLDCDAVGETNENLDLGGEPMEVHIGHDNDNRQDELLDSDSEFIIEEFPIVEEPVVADRVRVTEQDEQPRGPEEVGEVPRRTRRANAWRHPNPFHLPQPTVNQGVEVEIGDGALLEHLCKAQMQLVGILARKY